jgi:hypothetical protein
MGRLNKPAQEGYRYRSPGQTNAKDATPNLREDVRASQRADAGKIRRGLNTADIANSANRGRAQEAAGRAITRTASRAGLAGAALAAGYDAGRELDKATGVGRKVVDAVSGKSIDKLVNGSRGSVELSEDSKRRIKSGELAAREQIGDLEDKPKPTTKPAAKVQSKPKPAPKRAPEAKSDDGGIREGGHSGIDEDTRARAMASVRKKDEDGYAKGGVVKGSGAAKRTKSCKYI